MLKVTKICKDYPSELGGHRRVLNNVSFELARGEKIAVLGRNGAGKSTLIRLLGGVELPTSGTIERFVARVYGKPFQQLCDFVDDVAQLGKFLSEPVKTYSTGMMGRLN